MVVELRIHGVGGATPHALLGARESEAVERVGAGPVSAFYRRRPNGIPQPHPVEAYVWGGLTTQAATQPLWLLLLPFTLLNVAGFMPRSGRGTPVAGIIRRTIGLIAFTMTISWTLWAAATVGLSPWPANRWQRAAFGLVATLAVAVLTHFVARRTSKDFERVPPPGSDKLRPLDPAECLMLADRKFWSQHEWVDREVRRHMWTVGLTLALLVLLRRADGGFPAGALLLPVLVTQLLLLAVLGLCSLVETLRARPRRDSSVSTRAIGPMGAAALGVLLLHTGFAGLQLWVARALGLAGVAARPEQVLADVLGAATLAAALSLLLIVLWHLFARQSDVDVPLKSETLRPGQRLDGLPNESWRRRIARRRKLAQVLRRLGWFLAPPSWVFVALGILKLWPQPGGRIPSWEALLTGSVEGRACPGGPLESFLRWLTSGCGGLGTAPLWLARYGPQLVALAVPVLAAYLWRAARNPRHRAAVGILWDVVTFWPRWHHPFAVRSYADRAVPELQDRILEHLDNDGRVLLSVHSQGAVLAVAAVAGLRHEDAGRVGIVSFGSPLSTLHARFYPLYFGRACDFRTLKSHLASWRNFWRQTDYIGQKVRGVEHEGECLPDPSQDDPPNLPVPLWLDEEPRTAWTVMDAHSRYRSERALRDAVDAALEQLNSPLGGDGRAGSGRGGTGRR